MQLTVSKQVYDEREAALLIGAKRSYFIQYIRSQLKLKHVNDAYAYNYAEDVLQDAICRLLTMRSESSSIDEAISEAITKAVQQAQRESAGRKEVSEIVTYTSAKDGNKEMSLYDKAGGCPSAEQVVLDKEDECTLDEAIERAEASRYAYDADLVLNTLLKAGVMKKLWTMSAVNGLLVAFDAVSLKKYHGDVCIARVVSAAAAAESNELIAAMQRNLSRCEILFNALEFKII